MDHRPQLVSILTSGLIDERPRPAFSNCLWPTMGPARKTARA
jgi:hypothetical protein